MDTKDLISSRHAKNLRTLEQARLARDALESARQLEIADGLLSAIREPRSNTEQLAVADALQFAVDALCNQANARQARQLAESTQLLVRDFENGPGWIVSRPRSVAEYRIGRALASAIEFDGDGEEAFRRQWGLYTTLSRDITLGDTSIDQLLILRGVLSAAKRDGGASSRRFADLARDRGDRILDDVAARSPETAATYLHRSGIELRARAGAQAQSEALERLQSSLPLRPESPRARRSLGMATGEIAVLRGERERGARIMTQAALAFEDVLPRKFLSARAQLLDRGLLLAA